MGIRSLFAGVSGLRNFQQQLDIIGNNIANSQTAGYKAARVTFQDLLSQTSQGATAPTASTGGTNPQQFGLGSSIGAVDTNFNQGNLLTTGRQLDLAISGNGFFKLSDGTSSDLYTRRAHGGIIMFKDPIVEEVRAVRREHAFLFNYDLKKIVEDLRKKQEQAGRKGVSFPSKPARRRATG